MDYLHAESYKWPYLVNNKKNAHFTLFNVTVNKTEEGKQKQISGIKAYLQGWVLRLKNDYNRDWGVYEFESAQSESLFLVIKMKYVKLKYVNNFKMKHSNKNDSIITTVRKNQDYLVIWLLLPLVLSLGIGTHLSTSQEAGNCF